MSNAIRIIKEHDGRFAARSDEFPKIVGRGGSEEEALRDFKKKLDDFLHEEAMATASDYEDWDLRSEDQRKDID